MATYKVIQDIEAEDKLLGPLTLRQFIYAVIVVALGFLAFQLIISVSPFLAIPLLPPMIFFMVLAAPFGHDQSSELWLLAKVRFLVKPRRRIWDQNGMKELVEITVPKKIERHLTDNLSQTEVRSRLQALANTIDSRGWAVKNVNVNLYSQPSYVNNSDSDRLVDTSSMSLEPPDYDVTAEDDMLDESNNKTAQNFTQMIASSEQTRRQQIVSTMQQNTNNQTQGQQPQPDPQADYWFMHQPPPPQQDGYAVFDGSQKITQTPTQQSQTDQPAQTSQSAPEEEKEEEKRILEKIRLEKSKPNDANGHMHRLKPLDEQQRSKMNSEPADNKKQPAGDKAADPAILQLANNDDLNVATIARQADKARKLSTDDDVVISLR